MNKHPYFNQACHRDPEMKSFKEMGVCVSRVYITRTESSKIFRASGFRDVALRVDWEAGGLKVVKTPGQ